MARLKINFSSIELSRSTELYVIKPDYLNKYKPIRLLYLLHGYTGSHSDWMFYTNLEKHVVGLNMIVVMPNAYNGYYTNASYGVNYFNYLAIELPKFIHSLFNLEIDPKHTYIAGLSMGGYGALKAALTYPEYYSKSASFSGALDLKNVDSNSPMGIRTLFQNTFGKPFEDQNDLFYLAKQNKKPPKMYISCGTEDFLIEHNRAFHNHLNTLNIKHTYVERPGDHNWVFWEEELLEAIKFFTED